MLIKELLTEANDTKVKDKIDFDLDAAFREPENKPIATRPEEPEAREEPQVNLKRASAADTRAATANITPTDDMRDLLSRINVPDDGYDDDYADDDFNEPVTTDNLPAVISREIAMTDPNMVNPDWHTVSNLPGNMSRAIRTLGRSLFGAFTRTPTNDITMIGNLGGQGPNSARDVRAVTAWIREHGRDVDTANIDFDASIPGYGADIKQYNAGGVRFMIVRDQFGEYVYAWPESDSLDNVDQLGQQAQAPRLR
jgi:hypothetical protein